MRAKHFNMRVELDRLSIIQNHSRSAANEGARVGEREGEGESLRPPQPLMGCTKNVYRASRINRSVGFSRQNLTDFSAA